MKKKYSGVVCLFFLFLILCSSITLCMPAREFSAEENRYLTQFPQFSIEAVFQGRFQEGLSSFLNDQIPMRELLISTGTKIQKILGKKEINDVYLGEDGYYFQKFTQESYTEERMETVFELIEDFAKQYQIPVRLMLIPTPTLILQDKLPAHAPIYDGEYVFDRGKEILQQCEWIDLRNCFLKAAEKEQLYYRTDHHWTTQGAWRAYEEYCRHTEIEPHPMDFFELEQVSNSFYGTLHSKILDWNGEADCIFAAQKLPLHKVIYDGQSESESIYHEDCLNNKDQYAFFFGGNCGKITVKTSVENQKRLLVIKDSFANCFVPFLLYDYEEIIMLDLRFFSGQAGQVVEEEEVTEVLFLYEASNLLNDTGILKLLHE